ncbi:MAG: bifunctional UDP-N-acetylglucosamine diphosphorylase/glucosamine-1-phosphate N-acetyltransferase GlmU [Mariprofundaceae bacterium]|nr:bifunctional UDP-N-acetylglucosamine diphosphorylase/glucosamine-1-phosphate N-acetyltransferase GlmU [Mariprofundaceae bacterium]
MTHYSFSNTQVLVLAAGKGTRMRSAKPKVLHELLGKSMLEHVLISLEALDVGGIAIVTGHGSKQVQDTINAQHDVSWVLQAEQLGTGHAVQQCQDVCADAEHVLIVCGDTPLLQTNTLAKMLTEHVHSSSDISLLSAFQENPYGYGRIVRDEQGNMLKVVEERDANDDIQAIQEVSSGIFCVRQSVLFELLKEVDNDNEQAEYYLPSILPLAVQKAYSVQSCMMDDANEMLGINDRTQLRNAAKILQNRVILDWEKQGVTIEQPETVRIDVSVHIGMDTLIRAGTQLLGHTHVGDGCDIGPYAVINSAWVDDDVNVDAFSHVDHAHISMHGKVGPYARLRPEAHLDEGVKIGNFVEIKKAVIGKGSKVNHLSYIGDTQMGQDCNIGAGSITCNYDGANKHQTIIGDHVFVGSGTRLIAPVEVNDGATLGAGSIITRDVNPDGLTLSVRSEQRYVKNWQRPEKK